MASPVSLSFGDPEPVIRTAIQGTLSILNSALGSPSIRSVVLISSIGAIFGAKTPPYTYTEADWNDVSENLVAKLGNDAPGPQIYVASKTSSEKAFWKFMEEHKPSFSMTAINPVFVGGPPLVIPDSPDKSKRLTDTLTQIYERNRCVDYELMLCAPQLPRQSKTSGQFSPENQSRHFSGVMVPSSMCVMLLQ